MTAKKHKNKRSRAQLPKSKLSDFDPNLSFRMFVLGAGFSRAAGLPLARDLFQLVRNEAASDIGSDNHLERDLKRYTKFLLDTKNLKVKVDDVDFEEFLGFLDVEHYLGLEGSDTFSREGNQSQLIIRSLIGRVLHNASPKGQNIPEVYRKFARNLTTSDFIMTFNYDTILEDALKLEGVPYRLFPRRYKRIGLLQSEVDSSKKEVVVLKMHGSLDWFDNTTYLDTLSISMRSPVPWNVGHKVFDKNSGVGHRSIVDGPRSDDDPLRHIFRVSEPGSVLSRKDWWNGAPLILSPSVSKILYLNSLKPFWDGMQEGGGLQLSLAFIGYSLPDHDFYAKQALYYMVRNYQGYEPNLELFGRRKTKLRFIDLCNDKSSVKRIKDQYRFVNWGQAEIWEKGLTKESIKWLFR
jgi:hypothetical protein